VGIARGAVATLALAAPAQAGTISGGSPFSPVLIYSDANTGETVTVTQNGALVRFTAGAGTTIGNAAPACSPVVVDQVYDCALFFPLPPNIPTSLLQIFMGTGADTVTVDQDLLPVLALGGGEGGDTLTAKAGRLFRQRRLPVGTVIEVRITRAGFVGKVVRFKTRAGKVPKATTLCLQPGETKPGRC
jgi:hypothetical protein